MRQSRKLEHIRWALDLPDGPLASGFDDIRLIHNALPECDLAEVTTEVEAFGCKLKAPVLINALTGGNPEVLEINRAMAKAASAAGLGIAVGSQTGAVLAPKLENSFAVVREENPDGLVIANVGAGVNTELALQAVEMVKANALQVHLNIPQELAMAEGDRNFRGIRENIQKLVAACPVPVIVKEVGFGISAEVAEILQACGVSWLDVGGAGGTNFIAIEHRRGHQTSIPEDWGIPTAASLTEVLARNLGMRIVASGGIRSPLDTIKSLVLGASLVGIAGMWLKTLLQKSYGDLLNQIQCFKRDLHTLMLLLGVKNVQELTKVPAVITGSTGQWLRERGVDTRLWAQRV